MLVISYSLLTTVFAQTDQELAEEQRREQKEKEFQEALRQKLQKDQKMMEEFFQSDDFGLLQQRMKELMQRFQAFDDLNIDDFLNQNIPSQYRGNSGIETWWKETQTEKIFVIKAQKNNSIPFNITVEKGMIHINGTTLNEVKDDKGIVISKSYSSVSSSQNIPGDVDEASVKYDQDKDKNILIIFKKITPSTPVAPSKKEPVKNPQKDKGFQPIKPNKDDTTI